MTAKLKQKQFNWLTTLNALCKRKTLLTADDYFTLCALAGDWPTCACGQLCKRLPRAAQGSSVPADDTLQTLGVRFANKVANQSWRSALETFREIEKRSAFLLKEQQK